jgi:hypothetical protein
VPTGPLTYEYDEAKDVMTIEGVRYSGFLLRQLGAIPVGKLIRIVSRDDGVLTLRVVLDESQLKEKL